jgi:tRNA dimethylallyltransferase
LKTSFSDDRYPLVVIVGPTAVGKSAAAIELARRFEGEIISADSRLFYRGMDIGTAKPTLEEMSGVTHHLIDVADPDQNWSLALFQREARRIIEEVHRRGHLPFLVGGTGQYVRAVIEGWRIPPQAPDSRLRDALDQWAAEIGGAALHDRLAVLDPAAAASIDERNVRRTVRALEVTLHSGRRFSEQRLRSECPYQLLILGLKRPREELYARIDARIDAMIKGGLVEEVRRLLDKGYSDDLPTLSAIGYREIIAYLQGKISLDEAALLMKRQTHQFVRRQANWFKENDPSIHWVQAGDGAVDEMEALIRKQLDELWKQDPG